MKRAPFRVLIVCVLVSAALLPGPVGAAPEQQAAEGWIVVLAEGVAPAAAAQALANAHGGEVGHVYEHVLGGFSLRAAPQTAAALANSPIVERVEPDLPVHALADVPTGVSRVDAAHEDPYPGPSGREAAHDAGYRGAGTSIAILDTGIASNHPDLDVNTAAGIACITSSTEDVDGHGTHVAGTAAALDNGSGVVGVAPGAEVIPVKVLGDTGSGTWSSVLCGVDHVTALALGQVTGVSIDGPLVANMSLGGAAPGGPDENALRNGIADSVAAGVPYAVAAGNSAANADNFVPAKFDEVITVSAIADFDGIPGGLAGCFFVSGIGTNCDDEFASFSNFGSAVDVTAPGVSILSTFPSGYATGSGTSMASPHVAGIAALMLATDDTLTPADIQDLLQDTGECPDGTWNTGGTVCQGQGQWPGDPDGTPEPLVNAFRAADAAADGGPDPVPSGTVSGTVTDADGGAPIGDATVTLQGPGGTFDGETSGDGTYTISDVPVGSYSATATASGYESGSDSVSVVEDTTSTLDFALDALPEPEVDHMFIDLDGQDIEANGRWFWRAEATATVTDENGAPVSGATVSGTWHSDEGTSTASCTTGGNGTCSTESERLDERDADEATFTVESVTHPDYELHPDDEGASITVVLP